MRIEILDVHPEILMDELTVTFRDRRREIIYIESRAVDDRPDTFVLKKGIGRAVKSSVCFFQKVHIVKDNSTFSQRLSPDERSLDGTGRLQKDFARVVKSDVQG